MAAVTATAIMVGASPGQAYTHDIGPCAVGSGSPCYDSSGGQVFNGWLGVLASNVSQAYVSELCAKGVTQANNVRNGNSPCGYASGSSYPITHGNCLVDRNPYTLAYSYKGGGNDIFISGRASTDQCY